MSMAHRQAARTAIAPALEAIRETPHWIDRAAAGALARQLLAGEALTAPERDALRSRVQEIAQLRATRKKRRAPASAPDRRHVNIRWRGIPLVATIAYHHPRPAISYRAVGAHVSARTPRECVQIGCKYRTWRYGPYQVTRYSREHGLACAGFCVTTWQARPSRREIAAAIRSHRVRERASRPDPHAPDALGWRAWLFDGTLCSPHTGARWTSPDLVVESWDESAALRGVSGIHARRAPRDFRRASWNARGHQEGPRQSDQLVHGIVERFGRSLIGETGWRAEHVIIRELVAPTLGIYLALQRLYPEVRVWLSPYAQLPQEDSPCASAE